MPVFNSWRDVVEVVLSAGTSANRPPQFNEAARAADVAKQIAAARKYPIWPAGAVALFFLLPNGWIFALLAGGMWALTIRAALSRAHARQIQLGAETNQLREAVRQDASAVTQALLRANDGDIAGLEFLLNRWLDNRPACIRLFTAQITKNQSGGFILVGDAIRREMIPADIPRIGRGGRMVRDTRAATAVDEDLTELNAIAMLSLLFAIGNLPTRQQLSIRVTMQTKSGQIPWITLCRRIGQRELEQIASALATLRPSDLISQLGGSVGECRRQRLYSAQDVVPATASEAAVPAPPGTEGLMARTLGGVPVSFTVPAASPLPSVLGIAVPPAPANLRSGWTTDDQTSLPTPATVQGAFSAVARRFVDYAGNPNATFVPFESYWPTYDRMDAGQLKFYFKWRARVRAGDQVRTELSYIFVHIYELLHIIGANDVSDAGRQLEALWVGYRTTFPKLDNYCTRWLVDLYASEGDVKEAAAIIVRALKLGATISDDEVLVFTDRLWAADDYVTMPHGAVCTLTGDPRLGTTKFYAQYNESGWIDRAYREALRIADETYRSKFGRSLRDMSIQESGMRAVTRDPFRSAVYDWQRKPVVLGTVPRLTPDCIAVQLHKNATAYAENLLRAERGFKSKLRGVEVEPTLGSALDAFFARYVARTRPRAKVIIDAVKAKQLAADSEYARARLLAGLESNSEGEQGATAVSGRVESTIGIPDSTEQIPDGLLTDLATITEAIAAVARPTRAVLNALIDAHWELAVSDKGMSDATSGALLDPLVADLNDRLRGRISGPLLVFENGTVVVQEDYRDEVYWACRGTLAGFARAASTPSDGASESAAASGTNGDAHGFSPIEMRALELIFRGDASVTNQLAALASANATTPMLVVDRINEIGLASPYGDLLIDTESTPPGIMEDAIPYISSLLDPSSIQ